MKYILLISCFLFADIASAAIAPVTDEVVAIVTGTQPRLSPVEKGPDLHCALVNASCLTPELKFDFSALPYSVSGANVGKATLWLYVKKVTRPGAVIATMLASDWKEGDKNAQFPFPYGGYGIVKMPSSYCHVSVANQGKWVALDVTDIVKSWIDGQTPSVPSNPSGALFPQTSYMQIATPDCGVALYPSFGQADSVGVVFENRTSDKSPYIDVVME